MHGLPCPWQAKDFGKLSKIDRGRFSDRKDGISEPIHAEIAELFIKELDAQLVGEQRNVFNNGLLCLMYRN